MRDLYQNLAVKEDASESEIREALPSADPQTRAAASAILLNDHRRPIYDRNRRLMLTIGRLRFRLGLNLTPFWARDDQSDFTEGEKPGLEQQRIDSLIITRAFAPGKSRRHHHHQNSRTREILLATAGGIISLILLAALIYVIQLG